MDEFKDKVDAETKKKIENKISELESAKQSGNVSEINAKIEELNKTVQEIGSKIYQESGAKGQPHPGAESADHDHAQHSHDHGHKEKVVDAEFSEKGNSAKKNKGKA